MQVQQIRTYVINAKMKARYVICNTVIDRPPKKCTQCTVFNS
jgi:hypothetical protein